MPGYTLAGIGLRGVVSALPARRVNNAELAERFGAKALADITALTGVETRFYAAPGETAGDLCLVAAKRVLANLGWVPASVDALIFVSQTPDQRLPATACTLHAALGFSPSCQAFDVSLGCSGYVYGLWIGAALVNAGCRRVLLLAGDTSSRMVDAADRSTALLFGDAGSATAIEADPSAAPAHFVLGSDGSGAAHIAMAGGGFRDPSGVETLTMDGGEVFGFTLRAVPQLIRSVLERGRHDVCDVDIFALHQANRFMLRHITKKLGITPAQAPINIDRFGNTSSASIPLLLCTDCSAQLTQAPQRLMLAGFGVGFSWAAASFDLPRLTCAELIH